MKNKLKRIRRVELAVSRVSRLGLIYLLGGARAGGHIVPPHAAHVAWGDCSAWACYLCAIAGIRLKDGAGSTWSLATEGHEGESDWLTLYIKNPPENPDDAHVIIRLRHHPRWRRLLGMPAKFRWTECGGRDNPHPGGGPTWFRPSEARVAEFPIHRCFKAL